MGRGFIVTTAAGLLSLMIATTTQAQSRPTTTATTATTATESSELFPKGLSTLELTGGYITRGNRHLTYGTVGFGHYLSDNLEVRPEIVFYNGVQSAPTARMVGLTVEGRLHFLTIGRCSLFGEIGGGILEGNKPFPPKGTRFNFTYQAGVGLTYRISEHLDLLTRASFLHISNAFIEGRDRNPAFNGFGGYVGLMWQL